MLSKIGGDNSLSLNKYLRGKRVAARAWAGGGVSSHVDSPHRIDGLEERLNRTRRDYRLRPQSMSGLEEQVNEGCGMKRQMDLHWTETRRPRNPNLHS